MARKYALIIFVLVAGLAVKAHASDPAHLTPRDSTYTIAQSTIQVTSATLTVATIQAESGWREFNVGSPTSASRVYFRCDGSTANITTVGWWIDAGSERKIETNSACSFQVENGTAPVVLRVLSWRP